MLLQRNTVNDVHQMIQKDQLVQRVGQNKISYMLNSYREINCSQFGLVSHDQLPFNYDVNTTVP
jgi:hypothetical protein